MALAGGRPGPVTAGVALLGVLLAAGNAVAGGAWSRAGMAFALAVDPSHAGTVWAGTGRGGIFQSTNAGRTWRRRGRSRRLERIKAVVVGDGGTPWASDADGRLLEGTEGGATWRVVDVGAGTAQVTSLAVDRRTRPSIIYAGTSAGEVRRSADGGRSWTGGGGGLPKEAVLALAVDPRRHRGVLWAGMASGLFRSADDGATWTKRDSQPAREILVDPTRRRTVFVVREGVFRSTDGGKTWRRMPGVRNALSIVADPTEHPGALYVGTSYTSVLKSTDGGDTWAPANAGLAPLGEVIELAIDTHTRPVTLYAATSVLGVHHSTNGGTSWQADEGSDDSVEPERRP